MASLFLDICLSDIPKERIKEARNGKKYLKIVVGELRQRDDHDNDHYVSVYVPREERHEGDKTIFIGRGKENKGGGDGNRAPRSERGSNAQGNNGDLPF